MAFPGTFLDGGVPDADDRRLALVAEDADRRRVEPEAAPALRAQTDPAGRKDPQEMPVAMAANMKMMSRGSLKVVRKRMIASAPSMPRPRARLSSTASVPP